MRLYHNKMFSHSKETMSLRDNIENKCKIKRLSNIKMLSNNKKNYKQRQQLCIVISQGKAYKLLASI